MPTLLLALWVLGTFVFAGFYASSVGPLPFARGAIPPERHGVYSAVRTIALSAQTPR
jgi:hypothetical protein